jgi:hypothetical protein
MDKVLIGPPLFAYCEDIENHGFLSFLLHKDVCPIVFSICFNGFHCMVLVYCVNSYYSRQIIN